MFTECYLPTVNGVVVSVHTFREQLQRLGVEVEVVAPRSRDYRDADPGVVRLPSVTFPWRRDYPVVIPWPPLARRLCQARPDVVHVHSPFVAGNLGRRVARREGAPLVFTFHTLYEEYVHYVPLPRSLARALARRISRGFCQQCAAVVAPSEGIRQMLRRDGVTARIEVIPTGVEPAPEVDATAVRRQWGIASDIPLLAYVGRVAKEKSIGLMLEAFARVRARVPGAALLMVGDGDWMAPARAEAHSLGLANAVHFTGRLPREEARRCSAAADLLLFPSVTDTQGIVVLEAMAAGTPCVAARSMAVAGVVEDGANGVLVAHDAEAMAAAVVGLLQDSPRLRAMGEAARRAAAAYSPQAMARRLLALYRSLVERPEGACGRGRAPSCAHAEPGPEARPQRQ